MKAIRYSSRRNQRGAALVMALAVLVLLTILGISRTSQPRFRQRNRH